MLNGTNLSTSSSDNHSLSSSFFSNSLIRQMFTERLWLISIILIWNWGQFVMDGASTLVLEGGVDSLPSLNVSESAMVDGQLLLRISLPPTFSDFGVWQNYTIMNCGYRCHDSFRHVAVENVDPCTSIVDVGEVVELDNVIFVAVSFDKTQTCFAPALLPQLILFGIIAMGWEKQDSCAKRFGQRNFRTVEL